MATRVKKVRKGKKKWYPIQAPKVFAGKPVGETYVYEPEELSGRGVKVNLMNLTGNPKRQSTNVYLQISEVIEGKAQTRVLGLEMQNSSVKRLVRRGRSKVADSFLARTQGQRIVRVKPIVVTKARVDNSVQTAVRARCKELIKQILSENSYESIFNDITNFRLQQFLRNELGVVTPIKSVDIRFIKYIPNTEGFDDEVVGSVDYNKYSTKPAKPKKEAPIESESMKSLTQELKESMAADEEKPAEAAEAEVVEEPVKEAEPVIEGVTQEETPKAEVSEEEKSE